MKDNGSTRNRKIVVHANQVAVGTITEIRREETLLKAGALQDAIFNSANFSSIATDARASSRSSTWVPSGCWVTRQMR
jgi:hypothetical protein